MGASLIPWQQMPEPGQQPEGQHHRSRAGKTGEEQVAGEEPQRAEQMTEVLCERL